MKANMKGRPLRVRLSTKMRIDFCPGSRDESVAAASRLPGTRELLAGS